MRFSKRMIAGIITAATLLGTSAGVCMAAQEQEYKSKTTAATPSGDSIGKYVVTEKIEETEIYKALKEEVPEVISLIDEVNEGIKDGKGFVETLKETVESIEDEEAKTSVETVIKEMEEKELDFVTGFFDLDLEKDAVVEKNEDGKYGVTLEVPSLTESLENVNVLHYSTVRKYWEIIEPDEVDLKEKTLTAEFEDFSPVAIVAKINGEDAADAAETE